MQLLGVGVLGGALSLLWRDISMRRERESERREKIRAEIASTVALYNQVKAVRRILRSQGLDLHKHKNKPQPITQPGSLTKEQARQFQEQMLALNGLQLEFESKLKQFGQTNIFGEYNPEIVTLLGQIEEHLNGVLSMWEDEGWTIRGGTSIQDVSDSLKGLFLVTGKDGFGTNVSEPMKKIMRLTGQLVFGQATDKTSTAFSQTESRGSQAEDKPGDREQKGTSAQDDGPS